MMLLGALSAQAQQPFLSEFYDNYKQQENVTDVKLQGWLLKLAADEEEQAKGLLDKITHLRVLLMEEGNLVSPGAYRQLLRELGQNQFEELLLVKEDGSDIGFYIREKGEHITDALLLVNGADHFVLLSLEGLLKFSDLNDLNVDVEGADHFKRLPEERDSIPRA